MKITWSQFGFNFWAREIPPTFTDCLPNWSTVVTRILESSDTMIIFSSSDDTGIIDLIIGSSEIVIQLLVPTISETSIRLAAPSFVNIIIEFISELILFKPIISFTALPSTLTERNPFIRFLLLSKPFKSKIEYWFLVQITAPLDIGIVDDFVSFISSLFWIIVLLGRP